MPCCQQVRQHLSYSPVLHCLECQSLEKVGAMGVTLGKRVAQQLGQVGSWQTWEAQLWLGAEAAGHCTALCREGCDASSGGAAV